MNNQANRIPVFLDIVTISFTGGPYYFFWLLFFGGDLRTKHEQAGLKSFVIRQLIICPGSIVESHGYIRAI